MKKLSLFSKVVAMLLVTMLTLSCISVFADVSSDEATSNETTQQSENSNATAPKAEQPTDKKDIAVDEGKIAIYEKYAENENFILSVSTVKRWIKVTDKRTGKEWYSTPPGVTTDPISTVKPLRESILSVVFTDKMGNENDGFSETKCRKENGLKVMKIDDGVKMIFDYPSQGFTIPVEFKLTKDGFTAQIIYNEISERSESFTIVKISLLPFFGACDNSNNGYLFIPDGQGAIVDFKKANGSVISDYNQIVYGRNTAKLINAQRNFKESIKLPVFGMKQNNDAFIAIIEEGDPRAEITAKTIGSKSNYFNIYSTFVFRDYDSVMAKSQNWDAKSFKVFETEILSGEKYKISYNFLNNDKANYVGMAEKYRDYLINVKGMEKTAQANYSPIYLELVASIKRPINVAGFPMDSVVNLTNYDDVKTIVDSLAEKGITQVVIDYKNWYDGSTDGITPNKLYADNALGGKEKFNELCKYLAEKNIKLYANVDITDMYKSGNGLSVKNDSTRGLDKQPAMIYYFDRDIYQKVKSDTLKETRYLLSPAFFQSVSQNINKFTKDEKFAFSGISDSGLSNRLYSDFGKKNIDRIKALKEVEASLRNYKDATGSLMVNDPNAYALYSADYVGCVPSQSSNYYSFTNSVPFYQIVIQGYKPYSTVNINDDGDLRNSMLRALETGSSIRFKWVKQNIDLLQDTIYDDMINCDYNLWIDKATEIYNEVSAISAKLSDKTIINHEILQTNVTRTTFSDGTKIIINYNADKAVDVDGVTIQSQNYSVGR